MLVGPLARIVRHVGAKLALHPVDMPLGLDRVAAPEQARQPGMPDRDMQPVRIIVGDGLPVERARPQRHPPDRAQLLEAVQRHFVLIGRHHLRHRRRAGLERDEQEAVPFLDRDRHQPQLVRLQPRIFGAVRHPDQPPVARIGPGVIRAGQHLGASGAAIDQPRPAMAAHVGEAARHAIIPANDDHALAEIIEAAPVARLGDVADMAHHLRRGAQEGAFLGRQEFGVVVEPSRQAHPVERVGRGGDRLQSAWPWPSPLPFRRYLRQWRASLGGGPVRAPASYDDSRRGVAHGRTSAIGQQRRESHAALRACFPRASGPGPSPGRHDRGKRDQGHHR